MSTPPPDLHGNHSFMVGDWLVEPARDRLSRQDEEELVEPKTMAVLVNLAARANEVVSGEMLITEIWNSRPMGDNPVYKCIARLRKVLRDDPHDPNYIATVPRKGYCLIAPVTYSETGSELLPSPASIKGWKRRSVSVWSLAVILSLVAAVSVFLPDSGNPERESVGSGVTPDLSLVVMPFSASAASTSRISVTGNGIAEEISKKLSEIQSLRVILHDSVPGLNNKRLDIDDIAKTLRVSHFLVGEFHTGEGDIEIQGSLVNTQGEELWSYTFEGDPSSLFSLIDEIVHGVADHLGLSFEPDWVLACGGTRNIEACQRYQMAFQHVRGGRRGYKGRAIQLLEEAIALDPGFAAAHARIAGVYLKPGGEIPWPEAMQQADIAIQRALELDDELPEIHTAKAAALITDSRGPCPPVCRDPHGYEEAEKSIRRALSLRPGDPEALNVMALVLFGQGKMSEAFSNLEAALMRDPLNPIVNYNISMHKALQGDYSGARQHVWEFIEKHPNTPAYMYTMLAELEDYFGNFSEGLYFISSMEENYSYPAPDFLLAKAYLNLGMFDQVERLLVERKEEVYFEASIATLYRELLSAQGRLEELNDLSKFLVEHANREYGHTDEWPRWLLRVLGQSKFMLGQYEQAVFYLTRVHGADGSFVDRHLLIPDLDSMHALGYSLKMLNEDRQAEIIIDRTMELIESRKAQGYAGFPDLTAAEARAYAILGRKALAVATMRQAIAQGWRRYCCLTSADLRWDAVFEEPDFQALLVRVRDDVEEMRERVEGALEGTQ